MTIAEDYELDAIILDRENLPVAWIEVKARPLGEEWKPLLLSLMGQRPHRATEFILAIDPVCIQLFRPTERELGEPLVCLETPKILSHYEPHFTGKRIFEPYLLTLAEAWLRDLAYHWKSPNPPGTDELKKTGLLERVAEVRLNHAECDDVSVILYVETNLLMSVAMGREAQGNDLLAAINADFRVIIPSGCYMESFSAFEDERKRRNWFKNELDNQTAQLRRDTTSINAANLLANLEQSRIANDDLLNDILSRLFTFIDNAVSHFEPLHPTSNTIHFAVMIMLIPDPTDNLILHSILEDAKARPADTKALLTGNTRDFLRSDVKTALNSAGIHKHFTNVAEALRWIGSVKA